jgi:hypothetical protein
MYLSERSAVHELVAGSSGYDVSAFSALRDLAVWEDQGPPKGTLSHYPPTSDQTIWMSGSPAPHRIAYQIYVQGTVTKIVMKYASGESAYSTQIDHRFHGDCDQSFHVKSISGSTSKRSVIRCPTVREG